MNQRHKGKTKDCKTSRRQKNLCNLVLGKKFPRYNTRSTINIFKKFNSSLKDNPKEIRRQAMN